jgi:hypothetical protein
LDVLPWLFKAKSLPPGIAPKLSRNDTVPVAIPSLDSPATSARRYTKLPNEPPVNGMGFPNWSAVRTETAVVLGSAFTVNTLDPADVLGA